MPNATRFFATALGIALFIAHFGVSAQVNVESLREFSTQRIELANQQRAAVQAKAQQINLPMRRTLSNGNVYELRGFDGERPLYYMTENLNAADTVSTDEVWSGGSEGLDLDGSGQVLGVWDGGGIRDTHEELVGRVTNMEAASLSDHSTHVAGTMIAGGVDPNAKGMSFTGTVRGWDFNNDEAEMAAQQTVGDPVTVSNHSYEFITGWIFNFFGNGLWA